VLAVEKVIKPVPHGNQEEMQDSPPPTDIPSSVTASHSIVGNDAKETTLEAMGVGSQHPMANGWRPNVTRRERRLSRHSSKQFQGGLTRGLDFAVRHELTSQLIQKAAHGNVHFLGRFVGTSLNLLPDFRYPVGAYVRQLMNAADHVGFW
jgi:hypothetical protein